MDIRASDLAALSLSWESLLDDARSRSGKVRATAVIHGAAKLDASLRARGAPPGRFRKAAATAAQRVALGSRAVRALYRAIRLRNKLAHGEVLCPGVGQASRTVEAFQTLDDAIEDWEDANDQLRLDSGTEPKLHAGGTNVEVSYHFTMVAILVVHGIPDALKSIAASLEEAARIAESREQAALEYLWNERRALRAAVVRMIVSALALLLVAAALGTLTENWVTHDVVPRVLAGIVCVTLLILFWSSWAAIGLLEAWVSLSRTAPTLIATSALAAIGRLLGDTSSQPIAEMPMEAVVKRARVFQRQTAQVLSLFLGWSVLVLLMPRVLTWAVGLGMFVIGASGLLSRWPPARRERLFDTLSSANLVMAVVALVLLALSVGLPQTTKALESWLMGTDGLLNATILHPETLLDATEGVTPKRDATGRLVRRGAGEAFVDGRRMPELVPLRFGARDRTLVLDAQGSPVASRNLAGEVEVDGRGDPVLATRPPGWHGDPVGQVLKLLTLAFLAFVAAQAFRVARWVYFGRSVITAESPHSDSE